MAVRRISQLDRVELSGFLDMNADNATVLENGNVLSNYLFETSELYDKSRELYLSKKLTGLDLSAMLLTDITNTLLQLSGAIFNAISH